MLGGKPARNRCAGWGARRALTTTSRGIGSGGGFRRCIFFENSHGCPRSVGGRWLLREEAFGWSLGRAAGSGRDICLAAAVRVEYSKLNQFHPWIQLGEFVFNDEGN
jgi:hypothetical protein